MNVNVVGLDEDKEGEGKLLRARWTHQILSLLQASKRQVEVQIVRFSQYPCGSFFEKRNGIKGKRKRERFV